jgi:hypothetical protein
VLCCVQARSAEKALIIGKAALVFRMALAARAFRTWQMNWDRAVRAKQLLIRVHRGPAFQAWHQVLTHIALGCMWYILYKHDILCQCMSLPRSSCGSITSAMHDCSYSEE